MLKRKLFVLLTALVVVFSCVVCANAASYPSAFLDAEDMFQEVVQGTKVVLDFTVFREYNNEKLIVDIYNADGDKVKSGEMAFAKYDSSLIYADFNLDTSDMRPGKYTIEYYMKYYSMQSWHTNPTSLKTTITILDDGVYDVVVSGTCGSGVNWEINELYELRIFGSGKMRSFSGTTDTPWYRIEGEYYYEEITKVTIEEGVTSIGNNAFRGFENMTSVSLPSTLTAIGKYAFYGCGLLESVVVPDSVTIMGDYVFEECSALETLVMPGGMKTIPGHCIGECSNLTTLTISEGTKIIDSWAFSECSMLTTIYLPSTLTEVKSYAFSDCYSIEKVYFSASDWTQLSIYGAKDSNVEFFNAKWSRTPVTNGWMQDGSVWYYMKDGVKVTDSWQKDSIGWCYLTSDGSMAVNQWIRDSVGWCFVDSSGYMVTNTVVGGYVIDAEGYRVEGGSSANADGWVQEGSVWYYYKNGTKVTNSWQLDSTGWCYLTATGAMATEQWIQDSMGWCYVDASGYCVTNTWKKDSTGWCYLDSEGRMATNRWILDSVGWCYVGADGYCVTNTWMKDSIGWCYLDGEGRMVTNAWVNDSNGPCYIGSDGYMV